MTAPQETDPEDRPELVVVQLAEAGPLQRMEDWLAEAGITTRVVRPYADDPIPTEVDADGLIVMGGFQSALDDEAYPCLVDIRDLMVKAAAASQPILGVCLGGQLLARAFGGTIEVGAESGVEAGVARVSLTALADSDPVFGSLPQTFPIGALHDDAITKLPAGAQLLAGSQMYPHQAFRLGDTAWGLQFHPEVSPEGYARWAETYTSNDPDKVERVRAGLADLEAMDEQIQQGARILVEGFAAVVNQATSQISNR